ncbi:unnamed protein product, partial [Linum tenue]
HFRETEPFLARRAFPQNSPASSSLFISVHSLGLQTRLLRPTGDHSHSFRRRCCCRRDSRLCFFARSPSHLRPFSTRYHRVVDGCHLRMCFFAPKGRPLRHKSQDIVNAMSLVEITKMVLKEM